jgi:hypothetical protein
MLPNLFVAASNKNRPVISHSSTSYPLIEYPLCASCLYFKSVIKIANTTKLLYIIF